MISAKEFTQRREKLMELIPKKYSLVLVAARNQMKHIPTVPYKFSQHSDILYLTGYERPSGVLAITKNDHKYESIMFLPPRNKEEELWEGFRTPFDEAKKISGVDKVVPLNDLSAWLEKNAQKYNSIYESSPLNAKPVYKNAQKLSPILDKLRVVKSEAELVNIRKACEISKNAMLNIKKDVVPGVYEGYIAASFRNEANKLGATGMAYEMSAASGINALESEYLENEALLKEGDCISLCAGAEYNHYASRFARTMNVGNVPKAHHEMVMMVEDIKNTLIASIKHGSFVNHDHIRQQCITLLSRGLKKWGIQTGLSEMREICPNPICHWVGLDANDTPSIKSNTELKRGNVFSLSPSLVFSPSNPNVPKELAGLGIKFEDTIICE